MQAVLAEFNQSIRVIRPNVYHELEIRLKTATRETLEELCKNAEKPVNTIDQIAEIPSGQYVSTTENIGGKAVKKYTRKERKSQGDFDISGEKFRISYTWEIPADSSPAAKLLRIKSRRSSRLGNWRIDCTAVGTMRAPAAAEEIKALRDKVFNGAEDHRIKYEVELEYLGDSEVSEEEIRRVCGELLTRIDPSNAARALHSQKLREVAKILGVEKPQISLKTVLNAAVSLDKAQYFSEIFPPIGMFATRKAEGLRGVIIANTAETTLLTASGVYIFPAAAEELVADCEVLVEHINNSGQMHCAAEIVSAKCYIFDVMYFGKRLVSAPLAERINFIAKLVAALPQLPQITWIEKPYIRIEKPEEQLSALAAPSDLPQDGIILATPSSGYFETINYKWKPPAQMTIDFLVMKCLKIGIPPYISKSGKTLYLLLLGISHRERIARGLNLCPALRDLDLKSSPDYYPIQFSPPYNPLAYLAWLEDGLSGKICELVRGDDDEWRLVRIREDKSPHEYNSYATGLSTYKNYIDPFMLSSLWTGPSGYFETNASDIYKCGNQYRRFVISKLFEKNLGPITIDMAAGRGADLPRFQKMGVKMLFSADIDKSALVELISRHSTMTRRGGGVLEPSGRAERAVGNTMSLSAHYMDFLADYRENIATTEKFGISQGAVDCVVCNFAFHYFCVNIEGIVNALKYAYGMLKVGGSFIITVMDGKRVFGLFAGAHRTIEAAKRGGRDIEMWQVEEGGQVKYAIRREFTGGLAPAGQMISVKLPFAETMRPEPLANVAEIITQARKVGFSSVEGSFSDYLGEAAGQKFGNLTEGDALYISLHSYIVMKKKKD